MSAELNEIFGASLDNLEQVCLKARNLFTLVMDQTDLFALELLLREALTNSVVHGCNANKNNQVYCHCKIEADQIIIIVKDKGSGFDWKNKLASWDPSANKTTHGRGLAIYKYYATSFDFNQSGNELTIKRKLTLKK